MAKRLSMRACPQRLPRTLHCQHTGRTWRGTTSHQCSPGAHSAQPKDQVRAIGVLGRDTLALTTKVGSGHRPAAPVFSPCRFRLNLADRGNTCIKSRPQYEITHLLAMRALDYTYDKRESPKNAVATRLLKRKRTWGRKNVYTCGRVRVVL